MELRDAVVSDIDELVGLLALLFIQEHEFEPDADLQRQGLKRIIADRAVGTILVAVKNRRIVGMVGILYTVSTALGSRVALLEDMVVLPAVRGRGVGTALLHAAVDRCRAEGCRRITLLTDYDNHAAHRFYLSGGFEESSMTVYRRRVTVS